MKILSCSQAVHVALTLLTVTLATACDGPAPGGTRQPDSGLPDSSVAPGACEGTLQSLRELVFSPQCTEGCHSGAQPFENLDFDSNDLLSRLVGIPSRQCEDQMLVDPGRPDASLLVAKLEGKMKAGCGAPMPLGQPALPAEQIACVRAWIETLEPVSGPLCTYCDLECLDLETDSDHCGSCDTKCDADRACRAGNCECQAPLVECEGQCVDETSDAANCGGCGKICPAASTCKDSTCDCLAEGAAICNGACVDVDGDESRCGDCDTQCPTLASCISGGCQCPSGFDLCDQACVDMQSDPDHCGNCETACDKGQVCLEGQCKKGCGALARCGDACVDTATSIQHCGDCDKPCALGASCNGASCACPSGEEVCGGECTNTDTDESHCGGCDKACVGEEQCAATGCECPTAGETSCSGTCLDLESDEANCGECLRSCEGDEQCVDGDCACADNDETSCSGRCVDLDTDEANCGSCGRVCELGEVCVDKQCECSSAAVSFATDIEPLLVTNCANSMCHDDVTRKKSLNLSTGNVFSSLVDVDASDCAETARKRVAPSSIPNSYLIDKLLGRNLCGGKRMPRDGVPLLDSEIATISRWICQGAAND